MSSASEGVSGGEPRRHLTVVAGSPSAEELAVVVAVLSARRTAAAEAPTWSLWARKSRMVKPSLRPGFGAWRASAMPR